MSTDQLLSLAMRHWSIMTTVVGWTTAVFVWVRKKASDRKLADIRRRAEAPYLIAGPLTAHEIADPVRFVDMERYPDAFTDFSARLGSHKIEMHIRFMNQGQKVRAVSIKQPSRISLEKTNGEIIEGNSPGWLRYVYEHERRGQVERFTLEFESYGGFKQGHVCELVHGERVLRRVEP